MIFVTVGTHEQQFNRLFKIIESLIIEGTIAENVIAQTGYSTYLPPNIQCIEMLSQEEMINYVKEARVIITHGGPGSVFLPLEHFKKPIVFPRLSNHNEHINNHQKDFACHLKNSGKVFYADDADGLKWILQNTKNSDFEVYSKNSDLSNLCNKLEKFTSGVMNQKKLRRGY